MANELKSNQITTGTSIDDIVKVVDVGGGTPGLPSINASQVLSLNASELTSGTIPDARVAQTNVTQHEDVLAIDLPQLTQGGANDGQVLAWNNSAGEWQPTSDSRTDVSDNGTLAVGSVADINFSSYLNVTDDTDGTVTINVPSTGIDSNLVSGTAGTSGNLVEWNADGDAVDSGTATSNVATSSTFDWITVSSNTTASVNDRIFADTSSGAITITLPGSPTSGNQVRFADPGSNWNTNNLTIDGNGNNIEGSTTFTATTNGGSFHALYNGTQWVVRFGTEG